MPCGGAQPVVSLQWADRIPTRDDRSVVPSGCGPIGPLMGQKLKSSTRAYVFRCSFISGHCQDTVSCPFGATNGRYNGRAASLSLVLLGSVHERVITARIKYRLWTE